MDKYIGRLLDDRYEILDIIGVGGMAVVYKALCHRLNRLVAIKILKDEYLQDEELRQRFQAESQAVAKLSHANIVSVYDVSTHGDVDYIVMELIDGVTLKKHLQQLGVLSWREAVHFTMQIAKALEHAHSRGVIHRDIKPHNIMLLRDGSVKVADFGIARMVSAQNTLTREALGSVHYISPEQAKGAKVDNRADLYSLGVVMYEMLSGELPFQGESPVAVAIQHISATPRQPREINPNIPLGLEQITMKAMCADLSRRYSSATQMLTDLESFQADPGLVFPYNMEQQEEELPLEPELAVEDEPERYLMPPVRSRRRSRTPVFVVALCVLALIGVTSWVLFRFLIGGLTKTEWLTVPSLVGQYLEELDPAEYSKFVLEVAGIEPSEYHAPGVVLDQSPDAGESVAADQNVLHLTISGSVPTEIMPSVINKPSAEAKETLAALDIKVNVYTETEYSEFVEGQVIRTVPEAGSSLHDGDTVTLYISLGQQTTMVVVPQLVGDTLEAAEQRLKEAGLEVGLVREMPDAAPEGEVIDQSIAMGQTVRHGTFIDITVSSGQKEDAPPETDLSPDKDGEGHEDVPPTTDPDVETSAPEDVPDEPITPEIPQLTSLDITVDLPDGEGTILVEIKIDGSTYIEHVASKERGQIAFTIEGVGTKQMDVYFDGVLQETRVLDFGA